jgi:hypothetical protein
VGGGLASRADHHEGRNVITEANRGRVAVFVVAAATAIAVAVIICRFRRGLLWLLRVSTFGAFLTFWPAFLCVRSSGCFSGNIRHRLRNSGFGEGRGFYGFGFNLAGLTA